MLFGVTLFFRGREQTILGVVIDHGFGENLVIRMALGGCQLLFHKGGNLIHIKINIRQRVRFDVIDPGDAFQNAVYHVF